MIRVMNNSLQFTILYLPTRSLRIDGKQVVELTNEEFLSREFEERKHEFFILPEEVKPVLDTLTPKRVGKRSKTDDTENTAVASVDDGN